jgi:hypothetical protein
VENLLDLSPWVFTGVSAVAATLNSFFLIGRALGNYRALLKAPDRANDVSLRRISSGFIFTWSFIVVADLVRVVAGIGILLGHPTALELLLVTPFGSVWVAIVGLRSFR